ncbi:hypothetical protein VTO73DRAFT_2565 [Trametes versicolor]
MVKVGDRVSSEGVDEEAPQRRAQDLSCGGNRANAFFLVFGLPPSPSAMLEEDRTGFLRAKGRECFAPKFAADRRVLRR